LRISLNQVQALESDEYGKLPGATFIRGIIRSYAKLLQIDAQPLLAAYERSAALPGTSAIEVPTQNIRFTSGSGQPRNMRVGLLVLALIVIGGGAWLWHTNPNLTVLSLSSAAPPTLPRIKLRRKHRPRRHTD
jgi:cytoskeleton protein RodZ